MSIRLSHNASLVHFQSLDGLRIEGRLTKGMQERAVVLCHPHPLYGGSMLTPVIMTAEQAFQEAGYTTLAFNFRGSEGARGRTARAGPRSPTSRGRSRFSRRRLAAARSSRPSPAILSEATSGRRLQPLMPAWDSIWASPRR